MSKAIIKISNWINTKTYQKELSSISFIEDIRCGVIYLLKGKISSLWESIVKYQNYKKISTIAEQLELENQLNDFIEELKLKQIIQFDEQFNNNLKIKYLNYTIKRNTPSYEYFENIIKQLCEKNNLFQLLYLNLTYKCNLNCVHCFTPKDIFDEIKYNDVKNIIDEAYILGCNEVCLTGGECTTNNDFLKIIKYIRKKHLQLYILTNGQKLYDDEKFFNKVVKLYPTNIQISLYSMKPEIHDKITQSIGSHNKTMKVIEKLHDNGINIQIACFQTKYNFGEDVEVKRFANSINAEFVTDCTFIKNENNNNIHSKLCFDEITKFYESNINIKEPRKSLHSKKDLICKAGMNKLCITPELNITPCTSFNYILGNYKENSLSEIIETSLKEFHKKFTYENLKDCYKQDYCEYCIYCPTYLGFNNSKIEKAEILCEQAKAYKTAIENLKETK